MGKYFFLFYYYTGKDFSAFGSQKSSQPSVLLLLGNKIGQCKTQTTDYCFHHANEYVATKVPSFSNTKNNSPQSASYTALKQNLAPQPSLATIVKKTPTAFTTVLPYITMACFLFKKTIHLCLSQSSWNDFCGKHFFSNLMIWPKQLFTTSFRQQNNFHRAQGPRGPFLESPDN